MDIVEELRKCPHEPDLCERSAAEIERLRAALGQLVFEVRHNADICRCPIMFIADGYCRNCGRPPAYPVPDTQRNPDA